MARGDMNVETTAFGGGVEILNRPAFVGVPMTIDFENVSDTDEIGRKVVKGGTPIDKDGVPVKATPWTGAVGILIWDVVEDYPHGTIVTEGHINVTRAQKNTGLTYDGALVAAMNAAGCRIRLEDPITVATV